MFGLGRLTRPDIKNAVKSEEAEKSNAEKSKNEEVDKVEGEEAKEIKEGSSSSSSDIMSRRKKHRKQRAFTLVSEKKKGKTYGERRVVPFLTFPDLAGQRLRWRATRVVSWWRPRIADDPRLTRRGFLLTAC